MSIAEKLTTIAENQQRVYDAGFAAGQAAGGGDGPGYDEGYETGYAVGQQAEYDRFWDAYQINGNREHYRGAFCGTGWNVNTLLPKYSIRPSRAAFMFDNCYYSGDLDDLFKNRGLELDYSNCTDMQNLLYQTRIIKVGTIDCSSVKETNLISSIFNSEYLKVVRCFIPPNSAMAATCFQVNLETFIIGGTIKKDLNLSRCSKLTTASVQSIIDNLADLTGKTSQTITFHSTVLGKLTEEQGAAIAAKNWTL